MIHFLSCLLNYNCCIVYVVTLYKRIYVWFYILVVIKADNSRTMVQQLQLRKLLKKCIHFLYFTRFLMF